MVSQKEKEDRIAAQKAAKEKIAQEIKESAAAREDNALKLEKAAEEILMKLSRQVSSYLMPADAGGTITLEDTVLDVSVLCCVV